MKISETNAKKLGLTPNAVNALANNKGARTIGGNTPIAVGESLRMTGIDFPTIIMRDESKTTEDEWEGMNENERKENGRTIEYFALMFADGRTCSISRFLTPAPRGLKFYKATYEDGKYVLTDEEVDVTNSWVPSTRNIDKWIEANCDGVIGKSATLIGIAQSEGRFGVQNFFAWNIA